MNISSVTPSLSYDYPSYPANARVDRVPSETSSVNIQPNGLSVTTVRGASGDVLSVTTALPAVDAAAQTDTSIDLVA